MIKLETTRSDQRKIAVTGGLAIIVMALAAAFSYGIILENLVQKGDMEATFQSILDSNSLFLAGILGWLIILLCDIVVAWSFYIVLKPINQSLSLLSSWLRLVYAGILGIAILNLVVVSILTGDMELLVVDNLPGLVTLFLEAFETIWSIGLIVFGLHLMIVGYLTYQSKDIPKLISVLLLVASFGYVFIHAFYTFLPKWNNITSLLESVLAIPMVLGELGFGIWLLWRGGKSPLTRKVHIKQNKRLHVQ